MTISTVNIDSEHLERLGKIAEKYNRSKTQQVHQFIEDEEEKLGLAKK